MTDPGLGEFRFISGTGAAPGGVVSLADVEGMTDGKPLAPKPYPEPFIDIQKETREEFIDWLDRQLRDLISAQQEKQAIWADYETAYRAYPENYKTMPFEGASNLVVPVIAMAVDPIHARLDTGIFKQDPPITVKALRKNVIEYVDSVQKFVNYWAKNVAHYRQVASPRLMELTKLGTCVFKTIYDREVYTVKTYDPRNDYKVIDRTEVRYAGPRILGISLGDFLFPPSYQHLQDCPIVAERIRTSYGKLKIMEASGKLADVDKIKDEAVYDRTPLEEARASVAQHTVTQTAGYLEDLVVYEVWCDYDIDGNSLPEHLVATFHPQSRTLLQLRYNWYFNQKKPYVLIPYTITNESLYGIGLCEMVLPFQMAITKWEQMAEDNAYIANIRMFIVKKESDIEEVPRLYAGRCFFVDEPTKDFIPFATGDIYPSTLTERQNLMGLVEKRTGVSDYLTGRESPIVGSRATATSTIALIEEGTRRVEEVLENIREGNAEIFNNCLSIWMQYGLEGLDEMVLGDEEGDNVAFEVRQFFDIITQTSIYGSIGIDLTATDASGSKSARMSMQLQLIQIMMGYYEKLLNAMSIALQMQQQQNPQAVAMITDTATAARKMFTDLLNNFEVRNPEEYLPELEKYLQGGPSVGPAANGGLNGGGPAQGLPGGAAGLIGLPAGLAATQRQGVPGPALPGSGTGPSPSLPLTGVGQGI